MADQCTLGIDVGTSGCKILAVDKTGKMIGSVTEGYPCYTPQAGWSEQDPTDWWNSVAHGLKKMIPSLNGSEIGAVGFSGQMHGMVALDENREVVAGQFCGMISARKSSAPRSQRLQADWNPY